MRATAMRRAAAALRRPARSAASAPSLPVLDIAPYMPGASVSVDARRRVAGSLDAVCRDPGFFYLVGHGVPDADVEALHSMAKGFFALPAETKEAIAISRHPQTGRGYQRLGENVTLGRRDWHEAIDLYAEVDERGIDLASLAKPPGELREPALSEGVRPFVLGRNMWPLKPAGFRQTFEAHFAHMHLIGRALMQAMAEALMLSDGYFEPITDRSFWCTRIIGYPPLPEAEATVGLSCGEHTDYGCWTILSQDNTPGALEVCRADGTWITAEPVPGAFVVNLGDMLSVWTRRRYRATPHRVRQTRQDTFRTSVAFFFEPNFDAVIRPLNSPALSAGPAAAPELNAPGMTGPLRRAALGGDLIYGEHLFAKVSSNFDFTDQASTA